MIRSVPLLAAVLVAAVSSGMAQGTPVARLVGAFFEAIRSEAPVSGGDVLGLIVLGDRGPQGAEKIFVRSPSSRVASVCLEMVTRDGRYFASGTFELPVTAPGEYVLIPIAERTRYSSILRAAILQDLAVMTRVGRCDQPGGGLVPTAWGTPPPPTADVRLAVTVQGATAQTFLRTIPPARPPRLPCTRIRDSRLTAFDAYCEISVPANRASPIQVQLERCEFDECTLSPSVQINL